MGFVLSKLRRSSWKSTWDSSHVQYHACVRANSIESMHICFDRSATVINVIEKKKKKCCRILYAYMRRWESAEHKFPQYYATILSHNTLQKLKTKFYLHELSFNSNKFNMSMKEYGFQERKLHLQIFHKFETFHN